MSKINEVALHGVAPHQSRILEEKLVYQGQWIENAEITYQDDAGQKRTWECVHRRGRTRAVIIIPRLEPSGQYILIKQFRPPVGAYVLEFPAGLIDKGETPEQTAVRELKEETGYSGEVIDTTPPLYTSPGTLSESCYFVTMHINENSGKNQSPHAETEPGEFIEVFVKRVQDIPSFFEQEIERGSVIDIKLYSFFQSVLIGPSRSKT